MLKSETLIDTLMYPMYMILIKLSKAIVNNNNIWIYIYLINALSISITAYDTNIMVNDKLKERKTTKNADNINMLKH